MLLLMPMLLMLSMLLLMLLLFLLLELVELVMLLVVLLSQVATQCQQHVEAPPCMHLRLSCNKPYPAASSRKMIRDVLTTFRDEQDMLGCPELGENIYG